LTQRPSYDVKAFLRYNPSTFLFAAIGIEKSWGGEQMATNGKFVVAGLPVAIAQPNVSNARCTMKRSWGFSLAAMLCTVASIAGLRRSIAGSNDIDLTQWTPRES
jgi:hypothetical protein